MAFSSYSDLKSAISNWFMGRSDLASNADDFIDLAEGHFNQVLRCREMETTASLTPVSNVCTLPTDYLEYKRVTELASPRRKLAYVTEDAADVLYPFRDSGLANNFTIIGNSLQAFPLSTNNIELTYYQKIPALSDSATTNWLLARSPNLYLHGCLFYAAEFVKDNEEMVKEGTLMGRYIDELQALDMRAKFANAGVVIPGNVF
jgi:hypothetical protein